jgi:hypothetical protein
MYREKFPRLPRCPICRQSVNLENSKSDEHGRAVHENCYVLAIVSKKEPIFLARNAPRGYPWR